MEYITIAEYAAAAQISKQTAYKRARSEKYKGYFRRFNGVLKVDSSILEFNQNFNGDSTVENETGQAAAGIPFNGDSTKVSTIDSTVVVELLKAQVEDQAKQIEKLYEMVREKDGIIKELSANIAQITTAIQALQHEQNLLEAGKIQTETPRPPADGEPKETERNKRGLFSRFRRR